jgi:DNA-binding MarR family transcriptional regulator
MTENLDHVARIQQEWATERPDLDVSPLGVIARLHRLAAHLTTELVAVYRDFGLGEGDFDVLATLRRTGEPYEIPAGELAEHTMVTTGAMTKRIDRLQHGGLVTRRTSETDARGRVVALTPAGRELIDRAFAAHMDNERRLLSVLSASEAHSLENLLTTWIARVDDGSEPPRAR